MDFSPMAARYDELRPAWLERAELTLAEFEGCRRLLDVGCGTGRFAVLAAERLGARVWGVDPSTEMLARARARAGRRRGGGWRQASAEQLPFKDGWFDAVHAHLVLHLVGSVPRAVAEMLRVLGEDGRIAIVSFRPEHFDRFHLAPYFPSLIEIDRARFPTPDEIAGQLHAGGLEDVRESVLHQRFELEPETVLARVRGRYISTLHLLDEDEYQAGLARLERDLAGRTDSIQAELIWSMTLGRHAT
jgi:SAM-dependent methyltransferase